jgi:hypothetical protein
MIRRGSKITLITCVTVALVVSGAGLAAATTSQSASTQWNLNGSNSVNVTYDGSGYVYSVTFTQSGSSLSGTLTDSYYPTRGPVSGTVSGDSVTFTFNYPSGSVQGTRTYTGTISSAGAVSGNWSQTGSEVPDNGTWTLGTNAVPVTTSPPTPTCGDTEHYTVITQYAGEPTLPELFTDKIDFSWCAAPGSPPQIFAGSQTPTVEESGFHPSGILLALYNTAGITFTVTPATAPNPAVISGATSASVTASGLSYNLSLNLGQDLIALIPSALLARLGLKLLPFLRTGQLARARTQLAALWAGAAAATATALRNGFGLPAWVARSLAKFGLDKLVSAVKGYAEQFAAQAAASLAALGQNPTLTRVVSALESAIKTIAGALTFTTELWGPRITATVNPGDQTPAVTDKDSYKDPFIDVRKLDVMTR